VPGPRAHGRRGPACARRPDGRVRPWHAARPGWPPTPRRRGRSLGRRSGGAGRGGGHLGHGGGLDRAAGGRLGGRGRAGAAGWGAGRPISYRRRPAGAGLPGQQADGTAGQHAEEGGHGRPAAVTGARLRPRGRLERAIGPGSMSFRASWIRLIARAPASR
jgi:hypothetical protein